MLPTQVRFPSLAAIALRVAIVGLGFGTAYIHSTLGGLLFTLNALGYLVAALAMIVPLSLAVRFRWIVRAGLMGYAATAIAQDLRFMAAEIDVAAGTPLQLTLENRDSAPHNVAIYTDSSAGEVVYQGEIFSAGTRVYAVPALAPGSYFFRCDVHPDMTGTIVAK